MFTYALLAAALAFAAIVRLAPTDPDRWHIDPGTQDATSCTQVTATRSSARVSCLREEPPAALLTRLDQIALATPRTVRLAGSAETGRITWVTRSWLWGFPDFATAQATGSGQGARLDLFSRQRFGGFDFGVNRSRLSAWMRRL